MENILERIYQDCRTTLEITKSKVSLTEIKSRAKDSNPPRDFANALLRTDRIAIIAEIKFKSPSQGILHTRLSVEEIAQQYAELGADALSVLTEEKYFDGSLENIQKAKSVCTLPVLRKDFLFEEYQLYESRAYGADAILLIAAMLEPSKLLELCELACELNLDVLLELHDESDLAKVSNLKNVICGVNHRNLKTLEIDMTISQKLFLRLPQDSIRVAESGIDNYIQLMNMKKHGANAALVGTSLMKTDSPGQALQKLLNP